MFLSIFCGIRSSESGTWNALENRFQGSAKLLLSAGQSTARVLLGLTGGPVWFEWHCDGRVQTNQYHASPYIIAAELKASSVCMALWWSCADEPVPCMPLYYCSWTEGQSGLYGIVMVVCRRTSTMHAPILLQLNWRPVWFVWHCDSCVQTDQYPPCSSVTVAQLKASLVCMALWWLRADDWTSLLCYYGWTEGQFGLHYTVKAVCRRTSPLYSFAWIEGQFGLYATVVGLQWIGRRSVYKNSSKNSEKVLLVSGYF